VSESKARSERIAAKIADSQARLERDNPALPATPLPPKDAYPREDYRTLAGEYPWLAMAAGLGVGLLAGALVPKKAGSQFTQRALSLAMVAGEIALALSKQADDRAAASADQPGSKASAGTGSSAGIALARQAIKLAARARQ